MLTIQSTRVYQQSLNHSWHVHVKPEGNDTYAEMGKRCKSLGGHYNPYHVDLAVSKIVDCVRTSYTRLIKKVLYKHNALSL